MFFKSLYHSYLTSTVHPATLFKNYKKNVNEEMTNQNYLFSKYHIVEKF